MLHSFTQFVFLFFSPRTSLSPSLVQPVKAPASGGGFSFMRRGRQRKKRKVEAAIVEEASDKPKRKGVTFRFQEGFTNAVRRKVIISELL